MESLPEPPNFEPTEAEEEKMLAIVRAANPPGMARHVHFERLLHEHRRNKYIEYLELKPTTQ